MKKHLIWLSPLFFFACQSSQSTSEQTDKVETDSTRMQPKTQECFSYINNRDSVLLTLIKDQDSVNGQLTYSLYEKDRNQGIIKGKMHGDTLLADYIFNAEGTTSTRQVAFLKTDDRLAEGFGEVTQQKGKMMFKDVKMLKFDKRIILEKTECQ